MKRLALFVGTKGGRSSPEAAASWTSHHLVAGSNPLRGMFLHSFTSFSPHLPGTV